MTHTLFGTPLVLVLLLVAVGFGALALARIAGQRAARSWASNEGFGAMLRSAVALDAEQLARIWARYYESAHTFLYFDVAAQVSLSQNIASIHMPAPDQISVRFLQALEPKSVLVRPLGGTPRLDIVALDSRSMTVKLALPAPFIRMRIFGRIVPEIRNHAPGPQPVSRAARAPGHTRPSNDPTLVPSGIGSRRLISDD